MAVLATPLYPKSKWRGAPALPGRWLFSVRLHLLPRAWAPLEGPRHLQLGLCLPPLPWRAGLRPRCAHLPYWVGRREGGQPRPSSSTLDSAA